MDGASCLIMYFTSIGAVPSPPGRPFNSPPLLGAGLRPLSLRKVSLSIEIYTELERLWLKQTSRLVHRY